MFINIILFISESRLPYIIKLTTITTLELINQLLQNIRIVKTKQEREYNRKSPIENKTVLITGGTNGIGEELIKYLIKDNYKIIIMGRNKEKLIKIENKYNKNKIITINIDLCDFKSIEKLNIKYKIDKIFMNAGVLNDNSLCVNYLSNYLLIKNLEKNRNINKNTRIIGTVSSVMLSVDKITYNKKNNNKSSKDNINNKCKSSKDNNIINNNNKIFMEYSRSKLALALFLLYLKKKYKCIGIHPGIVDTGLFTSYVENKNNNIFYIILYYFIKISSFIGATRSKKSAAYYVYLCSKYKINRNKNIIDLYFGDKKIRMTKNINKIEEEKLIKITDNIIKL